MTPTKDKRAIVHVAGASYATLRQRCINCNIILNNSRNLGCPDWPEGAVIANHGRGSWAVLEVLESPNDSKYRPCRAR